MAMVVACVVEQVERGREITGSNTSTKCIDAFPHGSLEIPRQATNEICSEN